MGWVKYSTVGAKAGTDLKDESGTVLDNEDVRNDDLTLAYSGTNIQIKKAGSQIGSNVDAPTTLKNAQITLAKNASGVLSLTGGNAATVSFAKADVGLSAVTNESKGTMFTDPTFTGTVVGDNNTITRIRTNANAFSSGDITFTGTGVGGSGVSPTFTNTTYSSLSDVSSSEGTKFSGIATGATKGATFDVDMYKTGTTKFTAAELKNDSQDWQDVSGTGIPADGATVGAKFGTDIYDTDGSTPLTAANIKNGSITLNVLGYLDNIGTTERLSNTKLIATDMAGSGKPFAVLPASAATNNGSTINTSGNVAGVITVGSNISISSTSEYILISD